MNKKIILYFVFVLIVVSIFAMTAAASATGPTVTVPTVDIAGVNFMAILDNVVAMVPILLPVIIGFLAFRKGLRFLLGMLRGA